MGEARTEDEDQENFRHPTHPILNGNNHFSSIHRYGARYIHQFPKGSLVNKQVAAVTVATVRKYVHDSRLQKKKKKKEGRRYGDQI